MSNLLSRIGITIICTGTLSFGALLLSQDTASRKPYTTLLREFIDAHATAPPRQEGQHAGPGYSGDPLQDFHWQNAGTMLEYQKGDWNTYIVKPRYNFSDDVNQLLEVDDQQDVNIIS
ncbi:MAG TPA: hypothetical protein VKQ10_06595, partial [Spirochaetota bacterium]|nr:hypothetical protein [Spirochaetota bacterium]